MEQMLSGAIPFYQDISSWDTSSAIDMFGMFSGATSFDGVLSSWETSSVTDMKQMFSGAISCYQDMSSWDTSSVIDMFLMFSGATSFIFQSRNFISGHFSVTDMNRMFSHTASAVLFNFDGEALQGWGQELIAAFVSGSTNGSHGSTTSSA
jgi:surface protein